MDVEIRPEPSELERTAILLALEHERAAERPPVSEIEDDEE